MKNKNINRMIRVDELMQRVISEYLFKIFNNTGFDIGSITVTRVKTNKDLREAKVFISIRGHHQERTHMLNILTKYRIEIQNQINKEMKLKYTPKLSFLYDNSIEEGDRVLAILNKLEAEGLISEE